MNRLLLIFCSLAIFAACSSSSEGGGGGNGGGEVPSGGDTYGYIKDASGNPIQGVVVSDGFTCVTTDAKGEYVLTRNAEASYVYYSLPAGYQVEMHKTFKAPQFYAKLAKNTARYDFTLKALGTQETRFDLICIGDPQVDNAQHVERFKTETAADIKAYVGSAGVPCYGITLGDLVNNKWALFGNIVVAMQPDRTGLPVYSTIGNHDHEFPKNTDKEGRAKYEGFFGPVDYSFNRGEVHIVSMDNVIHTCTASANYKGGFSAEQLEWLKQDLSFVSKDKMIILCVHIPFRNSGLERSNEVLELLSQYKYATIMSAHTHSHINYIHNKNGKEIFEHITGTSCGAWWRSTVCTEGTPIGYAIYRIDGSAMKEWVYKSSKHDEDFQIRLYRASDKFTGGGNASYYFAQKNAKQIIANIWNWDPTWTVNVYENGTKTGTMTRYSDKDAWTLAYHIGILGNSDSYNKSTDHIFHYTLTDVNATVKVEAIDRFGNKYEQSVFTDPTSHPGIFHTDY
ncbi:calcineurin-like phosphoesterase family protein [uncultured Alistipes sp.]|jgi:Predicted phosphohydrolases|uniref:calcineurin-like phosphoesterase family protein n=1 Tax=uncultured Alistipes sp. TaxID=538949 RepID=UPI0025E2A4FA|nr:calcineurin-like phosphoesterase family protein [uncultured Alistipes sp.]